MAYHFGKQQKHLAPNKENEQSPTYQSKSQNYMKSNKNNRTIS